MNGFLNVLKKEIVSVWPKMVAAAKEWGDKGPRTPEKRDQSRESQAQLASTRNAEIQFPKLQPMCTVTSPCSPENCNHPSVRFGRSWKRPCL